MFDLAKELIPPFDVGRDKWFKILEPEIQLLAPKIHEGACAAYHWAHFPWIFVNFISLAKTGQLVRVVL